MNEFTTRALKLFHRVGNQEFKERVEAAICCDNSINKEENTMLNVLFGKVLPEAVKIAADVVPENIKKVVDDVVHVADAIVNADVLPDAVENVVEPIINVVDELVHDDKTE